MGCVSGRSPEVQCINVHGGIMAVTEIINVTPRELVRLGATRPTDLGILTDSSSMLPRSH